MSRFVKYRKNNGRRGVSLLRERLTFASSGKSKQKRRQERGQFECPLSCTSPLRPKRALRGPFGFPQECVLVRSDVAQRVGSSVRTSPRDTVECRARGRQCPNGQAVSAGKSKRGASAPLWSLRRVGGSKGEGDPFERVPFPLGVLLPSFPTREKKVAPAGAKLLLSSLPQERNPCLTNLLNHV